MNKRFIGTIALAATLGLSGCGSSDHGTYLTKALVPMTHANQTHTKVTAKEFCAPLIKVHVAFDKTIVQREQFESQNNFDKKAIIQNMIDQQHEMQTMENINQSYSVTDNDTLFQYNRILQQRSSTVIDAFNTAHKTGDMSVTDSAIIGWNSAIQPVMLTCLSLK